MTSRIAASPFARNKALPTAPAPPDAGDERILSAGKAVYDKLAAELPGLIRGITRDVLAETLGGETDVKSLVGRVVGPTLTAFEGKASQLADKALRERVAGLDRDAAAAVERAVAPVLREVDSKAKGLERTYDDHMAHFKASYDTGLFEIKEALKRDGSVAALVGKLLKKELDGDVAGMMETHEAHFKSLESAQDARMKELQAACDKALAILSTELRGELGARVKELGEAYEARLKSLQDAHEKKSAETHAAYDARLSDIKGVYEAGLAGLREMLQSWPQPQVTVNVPKQPSPSVTIPSEAIRVIMEKSVVNVTVPEGKAPQVTVNVPRRKTEKSILYSEDGQPRSIIETEMALPDEKG